MDVHLVLIETSSNQAFIFATNKLRENVGASELIYRTGTQYVLEAVEKAGGPALWDADAAALRDRLRDPGTNPPIESGKAPVEVIISASGKALLLVRDRETAEGIVADVTSRALEQAPGLAVHGAIVPLDFDADNLHEKIGEVHVEHTRLRAELPGPETRFQRLPIVAECRTSGLPAMRAITQRRDGVPPGEEGPASHSTLAKIKARDWWEQRAAQLFDRHGLAAGVAGSLDALEPAQWIAVVHADGNGLGQVFLRFDEAADEDRDANRRAWNREYIEKLRRFSVALDECTEKAFCAAVEQSVPLDRRGRYPIVPLVLGGDDLTVIVTGHYALEFTAEFLRRFVEQTRANQDIAPIVQRIGGGPLTASAGVAVVKPHFPFHAAYDLAESLLREAKKHKPDAAIDFQIVYDASATDLDRMRARWLVDGGESYLTARPYVVEPSGGQGTSEKGPLWDELIRKRDVVLRREEGRRVIPSSQLHVLRDALFEGRAVAEAQLALIRNRYKALNEILTNGRLFWECDGTGIAQRKGNSAGPRYQTDLLDVIEVAGLAESR